MSSVGGGGACSAACGVLPPGVAAFPLGVAGGPAAMRPLMSAIWEWHLLSCCCAACAVASCNHHTFQLIMLYLYFCLDVSISSPLHLHLHPCISVPVWVPVSFSESFLFPVSVSSYSLLEKKRG